MTVIVVIIIFSRNYYENIKGKHSVDVNFVNLTIIEEKRINTFTDGEKFYQLISNDEFSDDRTYTIEIDENEKICKVI